MAQATTGQRISAYRRRRGLSQAALAGLVGRSESWLSQVERGVRSVDRLSILLDLARVLHVEVEALTGTPWQFAPNGGHVVAGLGRVQRVMSRYSHLVEGLDDVNEIEPADLQAWAARTHLDYQAANYTAVVGALPDLLTAADQLQSSGSTREHLESSLVYVTSYVVGAKLLTKLGNAELAAVAADRAAMIAGETDSPTAQGMAIYQVVCALLRADRVEEAEDLAVKMAEKLTPLSRSDVPSVLSVAGALWLIGSVIAARRTDRAGAWHRLEMAGRLSHQLGSDANHAWTAFGPTNVAIHRVSVAAELGDPAEALRVAADVDVDQLPGGLSSRRAQIHLDLAWAQAQRNVTQRQFSTSSKRSAPRRR